MKLLQLELKSFRGATQPVTIEFNPQKNTTMVFGENGNGKSTISDALVCLLSEHLGSLDDRSSIRDKKKYLASTECNVKDVLIKLTTDAGTFTADLSNGKEWKKTPPDGHPMVRQLRRSHITNLIDAQPAERYEKLRSYIDVSKIEAAESILRNLEKEVTKTYELEVRDLSSAHTALGDLWVAEGRPGEDYIKWAEGEKRKDLAFEERRRDAIKLIETEWANVSAAVCDVIEKNRLIQAAETALTDAINLLNAAQNGEQKDQQRLIVLLQKTSDYLTAEGDINHCPVCTESMERESLIASINQRLTAVSNLSKLMADKDSKQRHAENAKVVLESSFQRMDSLLAVFSQSITDCSIPLDNRLTAIASEMASDDTEEARKAYKQHVATVGNCIAKLAKEGEEADRTLKQYNLLTKQYDIILSNDAKSKETEVLLQKTKSALKTVIDTRKKFVEDELNSIAGEVDRIYGFLHPHEAIGGIKLSLKPGSTKASLELNADFHAQKGINPQSLYSESHLDTLGICIFLALANKYNDGSTILILDDVVMSVDHAHLDRFIDLVSQEAKKFTHVLLTTHYRPWKDRYKHHRAAGGTIHFVELKPWTLKSGVGVQSFKMDYTDLQQTLEDGEFDRQNVAAKAGIFLENMLDFLASRYRCRLAYSADLKFTLGDYLTCFNKKLLGAMKVHHLQKDYSTGKYDELAGGTTTPLKDIIDQLSSMAFIRNEVGAHFNLDSLTGDGEVKIFGELTLQLAKLLICPEDGILPVKDKSGSFWSTPKGSIQLHPLKEPS